MNKWNCSKCEWGKRNFQISYRSRTCLNCACLMFMTERRVAKIIQAFLINSHLIIGSWQRNRIFLALAPAAFCAASGFLWCRSVSHVGFQQEGFENLHNQHLQTSLVCSLPTANKHRKFLPYSWPNFKTACSTYWTMKEDGDFYDKRITERVFKRYDNCTFPT